MTEKASQLGQKGRQVIKNRNLQIIEVLRERMAKGKHSKNPDELICYTGQVVIKKEG